MRHGKTTRQGRWPILFNLYLTPIIQSLFHLEGGNVKLKNTLKTIISILSKSLIILLLVITVSLFGPRFIYFYERGIYYGYDLILEYKISKVIDNVRQTRDLRPIALQDFSDKKIVRACAQSPYISQALFEQAIGEKTNDFNETSDHDGYLLWLFFSDGSISRVRIPMRLWNDETMSYFNYKQELCTKKNLVILFKFGNKLFPDVIYFYFNEDN